MTQWHTWGVIWTPTSITYTVDGSVWGSDQLGLDPQYPDAHQPPIPDLVLVGLGLPNGPAVNAGGLGRAVQGELAVRQSRLQTSSSASPDASRTSPVSSVQSAKLLKGRAGAAGRGRTFAVRVRESDRKLRASAASLIRAPNSSDVREFALGPTTRGSLSNDEAGAPAIAVLETDLYWGTPGRSRSRPMAFRSREPLRRPAVLVDGASSLIEGLLRFRVNELSLGCERDT